MQCPLSDSGTLAPVAPLVLAAKKAYRRYDMGFDAVVDHCLYGSVLVALAGYMDQDYMRFHAVFAPITVVVVWGSLLFGASLLLKRIMRA
jgi:hypothetical protein